MVKLKTVTLYTSTKHTWKSKGYIIKGQMNENGSFCHILFQRGEAKLGLWICVWLSLIDKVMSCYTPTSFNCTYFFNALDYRFACRPYSRHWSFIVETVRPGFGKSDFSSTPHPIVVSFCSFLRIHVAEIHVPKHLLSKSLAGRSLTFHRLSLPWGFKTL